MSTKHKLEEEESNPTKMIKLHDPSEGNSPALFYTSTLLNPGYNKSIRYMIPHFISNYY